MRWLVAGIVAFVIACLAVALAGCGYTSPYVKAEGTGKATARVNVLITVGLDGHPIRRRLVAVNNPTPEDHILDCHAFRCRVPAGLATVVLLMPHDTGCDLHEDVEYSPNAGPVDSIPIPNVPIGVTVKDVAK